MNTTINLSKLTNNMFRRVDNVMWDIMTGQIGVVVDDGIATLVGTGEDATININLMQDFGVPIPAYAQSTAPEKVQVGDIIINNNKIMWVIERKESESGLRFKTMNPNGTFGSWAPPKKTLMGMDTGVLVLRSLMTLVGGNAASPAESGGLVQMQQMMMTMAMMSGGSVETSMLDGIMPMMLMSQLGGANASGGGMQNMMMQMMMMQALTGQSSGGLFKPAANRRHDANPDNRVIW